MKPDDERHGEYCGYLAHRKDGEAPCEPCSTAAFRRNKAMKLRLERGVRHRVPIGDAAFRILSNTPANVLAPASGLSKATLKRLNGKRHLGPAFIVHTKTRAAILSAAGKAPTPIGLQRRLQALTAMGWSMKVAAAAAGFTVDAFKRVRREQGRSFVQYEMSMAIVEVYERLCMTPALSGRSAAKARGWAAAQGWLPPLAWDDDTIDDPDARPAGLPQPRRVAAGIDEVAVQRRMHGDRSVQLHRGEAAEVARRLLAAGWSQRRIEEHTGVNAARYITREEVA